MPCKPLYERTALLLGEAGVERLKKAHVLVAGLGGVGSYAAEALVRAGIGEITLVDADRVDETNLNRQLCATRRTIDCYKTDALFDRYCDINPDLIVHNCPVFLRDETLQDLLRTPYDYIVDAIDSLSPKAWLIFSAQQRNIPIIVSLGSAGKMAPESISITQLNQTHDDPLARALRHRLRNLGADLQRVRVVYSPERCGGEMVNYPENEADDLGKRSVRGTISYLPAMFGLYAASEVIRRLVSDVK